MILPFLVASSRPDRRKWHRNGSSEPILMIIGSTATWQKHSQTVGGQPCFSILHKEIDTGKRGCKPAFEILDTKVKDTR